MDTLLLIIGILLILGSVLFALTSESSIKENAIIVCLLGMLTFGFGVQFSVEKDIEKHANIIPAIDVYRGKTTLQITYQDSIAIDSIVVYKKN